MGDAVIQRDKRGRIVAVSIQPGEMSEPVRLSVLCLLRAVSESLQEYLHVDVQSSFKDDNVYVEIDRQDQYLDREIDAVLVTTANALRIIEREFPSEMIVHDTAVEVEV